ncbi:hypothetical protein [Dysgonomonas sp. 520]|uniref:hypothetical protein n=1 Tax=Dysgonomonas sp. 520 TaxID=2302931 RepID=UPI0013D003D8|nr:hypothetical protein [Dysgonomonas sp. 520]NDW09498.1 hypothetical protein [Dysgonomonas sp. 520]
MKSKEIIVSGVVLATIIYPELGFAFNPLPIIVETPHKRQMLLNITKKEGDTLNTVTLNRNTIKNKDGKNRVTFDISGIVRSMFDRNEFVNSVGGVDNELIKNIDMTVMIWQGPSTYIDVPVIWGALQIGETYTQSKRLTMFKGYPFSVPLYLPNGTYSMVIDGEKDDYFEGGKYNTYIHPYIAESHSKKSVITILGKPEAGQEASLFDYTFDYTFRKEAVNDINIIIDVEDCQQDGFYLRWINRYGEWNYYLFHKKGESTQTSDSSVVFDQYFTSVSLDDNNGYHPGTGKPIGKEVKKSIQLYASLVDANTFDFLSQMVQSPVVDLLVDYNRSTDRSKWVGVKTQAGTFGKSNQHLQDFEFTLVMPDVFTQKL